MRVLGLSLRPWAPAVKVNETSMDLDGAGDTSMDFEGEGQPSINLDGTSETSMGPNGASETNLDGPQWREGSPDETSIAQSKRR